MSGGRHCNPCCRSPGKFHLVRFKKCCKKRSPKCCKSYSPKSYSPKSHSPKSHSPKSYSPKKHHGGFPRKEFKGSSFVSNCDYPRIASPDRYDTHGPFPVCLGTRLSRNRYSL